MASIEKQSTIHPSVDKRFALYKQSLKMIVIVHNKVVQIHVVIGHPNHFEQISLAQWAPPLLSCLFIITSMRNMLLGGAMNSSLENDFSLQLSCYALTARDSVTSWLRQGSMNTSYAHRC